jgi:MFS transporter, SP family, sugar:H+ symporter
MGIGFLWPLILGFGILLFPDSPRFDYRKGRVQKAVQTMTTMYGVDASHFAVYKEVEEIKAKLEAESASGKSWIGETFEMFSAPRMAYRITVGVLLQMFQQVKAPEHHLHMTPKTAR